MKNGTIIIADRDAELRTRLAERFATEGYQVQALGTVAGLLQTILTEGNLVLLLDSDLDDRVAPSDLMHLLKKCHRQLQVILVSDQITLPLARRVREEGVFFHALRPATAGDADELAMAVEAAFRKSATCDDMSRYGFEPARLPERTPEPHGLRSAAESHSRLGPVTTLVLMVAGAGYLAASLWQGTVSLSICIFAAFCAIIIVSQLLPIFSIRLPARFHLREHAREWSKGR